MTRSVRDVSRCPGSERWLEMAAVVLLTALLAACGGAAPEAAYPAEPGGAYADQAPAAAKAADMAEGEGMMAEPMPAPAAAGGAVPLAPPPAPAPPGQPSSPGEDAGMARPVPKAPGPSADPKGADRSGSTRAKEGDPSALKQTQPSVAQMLIYTAQLRVQVLQKTFPQTIDTIVDIAVGKGGYLAKHDNATVQVRVPSVRFRETLKEIEQLGKVTHRAVQAQDVTEEYHDLSVRLKSLRATRDRLEQFLGRAKNIQEVLSVEKELGRINAEIDRVEGRMRFLASKAAFSTITVALEPKPETVIARDSDEDAPPPPPPRTLPLPIEWLARVGLDHLLQLN